MALTKTITKIFPTKDTVGINLVLEDEGVKVVDEDITENYTESEGITKEVKDSIERKTKERIKTYKRCKAIYAEADDLKTQIENNVTI